MGQILHGSATTTEAVRRAIQHSQESLRSLAKRYGINQKTVAKWKKRTSVADIPTGPTEPKSTVLSGDDEGIIVAFRRHTLLPLDDCLYSLQATIPHLTRSSLHRCLQRHGISRLPEVEGDKPTKKKFKAYPVGFFHIDIAEVQTAEGKLYLYVGIDRTSKFAFVQLVDKATTVTARAFLDALRELADPKRRQKPLRRGVLGRNQQLWALGVVLECVQRREALGHHAQRRGRAIVRQAVPGGQCKDLNLGREQGHGLGKSPHRRLVGGDDDGPAAIGRAMRRTREIGRKPRQKARRHSG